MTRDEVRLRILELATPGAPDASHAVMDADTYAEFVFDREPKRLRSAPIAMHVGRISAKALKPIRLARPMRGISKKR